ncbi:hypothetical protein E3U55_08210 [Filobacillus milosensis]|uniref:Uncharacterized protein n=1 Tax=Filobacillus milosensis TaxID=94137 RepID=A0A4Y8IL34_9BACI|nr:hypothetical protein [Filobacillus milosensis]TFB21798.1 hypothetical protein E3U55_08210 [Filobacillus milosensis]
MKKGLIGFSILLIIAFTTSLINAEEKLKVHSKGIENVIKIEDGVDAQGRAVEKTHKGVEVVGNIHLSHEEISGMLNDVKDKTKYQLSGENIYKNEESSVLTYEGHIKNHENLMFQAEATKRGKKYQVYFNIVKVKNEADDIDDGEVISSYTLNGEKPKTTEKLKNNSFSIQNYYEKLGDDHGYYYDIRHEGNKTLDHSSGSSYYQVRMTTNSSNVDDYWQDQYPNGPYVSGSTVKQYNTEWYSSDDYAAYRAADPESDEEINYKIPFWSPYTGPLQIPVSIKTADVLDTDGSLQMGVNLYWGNDDYNSYKDDNTFSEDPEEGDGFAVRVYKSLNYPYAQEETFYVDHMVRFRTSFTAPGATDKYLRVNDTTSYTVTLE